MATSRNARLRANLLQVVRALAVVIVLLMACSRWFYVGERAGMTRRGIAYWSSAEAEANGTLIQRIPLAPASVPVDRKKLRVLEAWAETAHETKAQWLFWMSDVKSDHAVLAFLVDPTSVRAIRGGWELAEGGRSRSWVSFGTGDAILYFRQIEGALPDSLRLEACLRPRQEEDSTRIAPRWLPDCPPYDDEPEADSPRS